MQFNVINENYNPKKWKYAQKPLSSFQLFKCLVFVTISDTTVSFCKIMTESHNSNNVLEYSDSV